MLERGANLEGAEAVAPDLGELIGLRRLLRRLPPGPRGASPMPGPAVAARRGRGMDYAESRPYAPGDDARHVDWRVSARTGRLHSKTYHAERERVSLILADTAPALYFGTRARFKSVQAARAGALAAWAAQRAGDRVGALRATRAEPPLPPQGGLRGVLPALRALARWYRNPPADALDLAEGLRAARRLLHPGASLLVLADPYSFEAVSDAELAALTAHCELRAVLLVDRLELDPPRAPVRLADGGREWWLDLSQPAVRAAWDARFGERYQAIAARLRSRRVQVLSLAGEEPVERLLRLLPPAPGRAA